MTVRVREAGGPIELKAERLLVATGRTPNTDALGLAEAGVVRDGRGAIVVDDRMRTSKPGVYAAGDVTDRDPFVYMAAHGAKLAALNALDGDRLVYDNAAMPWVVFTDPQVSDVGRTEAAAKAAGHAINTSVLPLDQVPRAVAARDTRGLVKLVADGRTDRLVGGQILAPEGADSIQTLALALKHGTTAKALAETIFPLPHDGRGAEARRPGLREGRGQAHLLRGGEAAPAERGDQAAPAGAGAQGLRAVSRSRKPWRSSPSAAARGIPPVGITTAALP